MVQMLLYFLSTSMVRSPRRHDSARRTESWRNRSGQTELRAQRRHVAVGLDVVLRQLDQAVRPDHHGGPDDAGDRAAVLHLLAVRAVGDQRRRGPVGGEREGQLL